MKKTRDYVIPGNSRHGGDSPSNKTMERCGVDREAYFIETGYRYSLYELFHFDLDFTLLFAPMGWNKHARIFEDNSLLRQTSRNTPIGIRSILFFGLLWQN